MLRMRFLALVLSFVSTASACSAAYADQPAPRHRLVAASPRTALAMAPEKIRAPYDVTLIGEDGSPLETFAQNGRYYVMGDTSERYIIRVNNPTPNRVEAVVSVDGLDVIDGENGELGKRGYIVPPYGDLRIEGFRTSQSDVATFRFSSVSGSYAGKKGKARNVGVIAVALFEEQAPPEMVEEQPIAIAELRYNDRAGLAALGIAVAPAPDEGEIMMRETADPFPGDRFARPPR
jgi:hypothetical protein